MLVVSRFAGGVKVSGGASYHLLRSALGAVRDHEGTRVTLRRPLSTSQAAAVKPAVPEKPPARGPASPPKPSSSPTSSGPVQGVPVQEALQHILHHALEVKKRKFNESVDIAIVLGVDPRKPNQGVRGVQTLPHGTGQKVRVAVFAKGQDVDAAKAAGATLVGAEDLVKTIQDGALDFDRCVATPEVMPLVSRVARILGPRGLMPNPKMGTVTKDVAAAVKAALGGQVQFKADKFGMVHASIGKVSFPLEALMENVRAFMVAISNAKPEGAKGTYIKSVHVSTTMGKGCKVETSTVDPRSSRFMLSSSATAPTKAQ